MLQRYDISMDFDANRLSIKEFAVLERITRKRENFEIGDKKFSLINKSIYDGDLIRAAMVEGKGALISALRSDSFFPIRSSVDIIVERVIELFEDNSSSSSEVIVDDQAFFSTDDQ